MANRVEKVNYFTRVGITRHEKLQRAKELYIDFLDQNNHEKFSTFSPDANKYILDTFKKYSPDQIKAFRKYVGIRERKGKNQHF